MDIYEQRKRSEIMSRVRAKDTNPELLVRRFLHRRGLRYRLHRADLPGRPDIVLPSRRIALFVHGCFWHRHPGCKRAKLPMTRQNFWKAKFEATVERDARTVTALQEAGWTVLVIWQCEIEAKALEQLYGRIIQTAT